MHASFGFPRCLALFTLLMLGSAWTDSRALAASAYVPISPTMADRTITLTGRDLTAGEVVQVARYGAKVELSAEATQRQNDNYVLLLEAAAEGIAVYGFNRGAGDQRETVTFSGDPMSAQNKAYLTKWNLRVFQNGALVGHGPEVAEEEIVRAMMVVRANAMTHNAPSPQLSQMLIELLNRRITPVVPSRGTVGEGDLAQLSSVGATMVGAGDAYYEGVRMTAAAALAKAGLKPIEPFADDVGMLISSDAYATGIAALLVDDARRALEWADLIYAMDLNGMNSSITPLSAVAQRDRSFKWLNWDAARVLRMIRGSYLFEDDPKRIIQDPESLRASSIRQGSAWQDWAALRDAVLLQMNSSDHNPAVRTDLSPEDSWELSTPQMMKYYVRGGERSNGKHGYVVSNANWDPYPLANKLEAFVIALANMDLVVCLRIDRFNNPFFTAANPALVLHERSGAHGDLSPTRDYGYSPVDLQQEIQSLTNPIAPSGAAIVSTVEDLQAQTRIKAYRARQAVDTTFDLLAYDLLTGAFWMDLRQAQNASRSFGPAPTAARDALRKIVPLQRDPAAPRSQSDAMAAASFLKTTAASTFYSEAPPMPVSE
jgi:histidine ammonia-lyase